MSSVESGQLLWTGLNTHSFSFFHNTRPYHRNILHCSTATVLGYWHQRADERHGKPPQGNQERLVVKDNVGRPPGELGVSKSMECDIFPSVLRHCWLGDRKGIRPVKNWVLVCWCWWFDWSFARLVAPVVTTASIILCFNKHRLTRVHLENGCQNGEIYSWQLEGVIVIEAELGNEGVSKTE